MQEMKYVTLNTSLLRQFSETKKHKKTTLKCGSKWLPIVLTGFGGGGHNASYYALPLTPHHATPGSPQLLLYLNVYITDFLKNIFNEIGKF